MDLISLLVGLIIIGVIVYAVTIVVNMFPIPPQIKTLVYLVVGVVALVALLRFLGISTPAI